MMILESMKTIYQTPIYWVDNNGDGISKSWADKLGDSAVYVNITGQFLQRENVKLWEFQAPVKFFKLMREIFVENGRNLGLGSFSLLDSDDVIAIKEEQDLIGDTLAVGENVKVTTTEGTEVTGESEKTEETSSKSIVETQIKPTPLEDEDDKNVNDV